MNKKQKIKEDILRSLEEKRKMRCPFCKHDKFYRSAIENPCLVEIYDDGDSMRDEDIEMCQTNYTYKCAKCKKNVTEEELV